MGIDQIFSEPDLLGCRRQGNQFCPRPGIPDMRQIKPRFGLISLIASCAFFSTCIPISFCGNLFLGPNRSGPGENYRKHYKSDHCPHKRPMGADKRFQTRKILDHLPPLTRLMDPQQGFFGYTVIHILQSRQISILVLMTGLARIGNFGVIQRVFRQQGYKRMGVIVAGFLALGDSRHMTSDAVSKRVNGMGHVLVNHLMTHQTLLRPGSLGLKLGRRYTELMDVVA